NRRTDSDFGSQGVGFDGIRLSLARPLPASLVEPGLLRRQQRHPTFSDCTQPGCPAWIRAPLLLRNRLTQCWKYLRPRRIAQTVRSFSVRAEHRDAVPRSAL